MARIRLSDIAAEAGVSTATVSKYLNGHHNEMSEATRTRIAEVVERTGYRPNSTARNLRLDRSRTIGVILADIKNPYSSAMLEELSQQAGEAGYALTCAISGNDSAREAAAVERLLEAGVDALIVNTCGGCDELLLATNRHTPVILLDRDLEHKREQEQAASANPTPAHDNDSKAESATDQEPTSTDTPASAPSPALDLVTSDNATLMAALVHEVTGAGSTRCTRIHLLTEADATSSIRRERALTFMRELGAHGISGSTLALPTNPREAARQLAELADAHMPLGLIAINGLVFQQLVEAISLSGLLVPERLRIATFDEYPWNRVLFGGVTTAAQDTHAIAAAILERIFVRVGNASTAAPTGNATAPAASSAAAATGNAGAPARIEIPGRIIRRTSTR